MFMDDEELYPALSAPPQGPTIAVPLHDSPENASGWRDLGMKFSCVPHAVYPWTSDVLRAIWMFDPGIVPIWIEWSFQAPYDDATPGRIKTFGRHAVGRYKPILTNNVPKIESCDMPAMPCQGVTFKKPNILIRMFEGAPTPGLPADLPGSFVPWDFSIAKRLEQLFVRSDTSAKELAKQVVGGITAEHEKRRASLKAEHDDRMKDLRKFVDKKLESMSDREVKEHFQRRQHRTRVSRPYIDLGDVEVGNPQHVVGSGTLHTPESSR